MKKKSILIIGDIFETEKSDKSAANDDRRFNRLAFYYISHMVQQVDEAANKQN